MSIKAAGDQHLTIGKQIGVMIRTWCVHAQFGVGKRIRSWMEDFRGPYGRQGRGVVDGVAASN